MRGDQVPSSSIYDTCPSFYTGGPIMCPIDVDLLKFETFDRTTIKHWKNRLHNSQGVFNHGRFQSMTDWDDLSSTTHSSDTTTRSSDTTTRSSSDTTTRSSRT